MSDDTSFRDEEAEAYRRRVFEKPLDELSMMEFTKMARFIREELGYGQPIFLYIQEYMRRYVAERRNTNSSLTGLDIYEHTKSITPKYYKQLKRGGKLTMEDARMYRDEGWKKIPE